MEAATPGEDVEQNRIVLGLLEQVERGDGVSQRRIAAELGIALGLVNAYLKRCVKKGLVKVTEAPARRYAYYLTPKGLTEKSRLTVEYLSDSFSFFRGARADCAETLKIAADLGWKRVALVGISDLAEIAIICGMDSGVEVVTVVDERATVARFAGLPVMTSFAAAARDSDGALLTELKTPAETLELAKTEFGVDRVLLPALLARRLRN